MAQVAYVIGNGPSKRLVDWQNLDGETYGCNLLYKEHKVDHLFSVDYFYQLDILADAYPAESVCYFSNWYPLNVEMNPKWMDWPKEYEIVEINPEARENAIYWTCHFYPKARYESLLNTDMVSIPEFLKPNVGLIYWVPAGFDVKNLVSALLPLDARVPPSGAFALEKALQSDVERVEVYGFDSVAGNFNTSSDVYFANQQKNQDSKRSVSYKEWYEKVTRHYNKEVIWHTIEV